MCIFSPFEQFIINPIFYYNLYLIDLTITNITIFLFIILFFTIIYLILIRSYTNNSIFILPTDFEAILYFFFFFCQSILQRHVQVPYFQQEFFPIVFSLASFLLIINFTGNIPMCLSLTSQAVVLCSLILPSVISIFLWGIYQRQLTFLRTFHSPGIDSMLAALVFPIEVITYFMRPISIIIRLFANFMSGHVIFKVILNGVYNYALSTKGVLSALLTIPFLLGLIPLIILELAISGIQVYVFLVIFGMFLADTLGHHYRH